MAIEIVDFPINSMVIFHCYGDIPIKNGDFPINSMVIFHGKMLVHQAGSSAIHFNGARLGLPATATPEDLKRDHPSGWHGGMALAPPSL